jgi:hypothetical protein
MEARSDCTAPQARTAIVWRGLGAEDCCIR